MFWKIFIIQPYTERLAAHKFFTGIVTFFIMKQVKIINVSACADCLMYFDLLLFCRIDLCLEALQQSPHPFLLVFILTNTAHMCNSVCLLEFGLLFKIPSLSHL